MEYRMPDRHKKCQPPSPNVEASRDEIAAMPLLTHRWASTRAQTGAIRASALAWERAEMPNCRKTADLLGADLRRRARVGAAFEVMARNSPGHELNADERAAVPALTDSPIWIEREKVKDA